MKFEKRISPVNGPVIVMSSVLVETPRKIELRIGEEQQGKGRYALLTPRDALRLAAILLEAAEDSLQRAETQG